MNQETDTVLIRSEAAAHLHRHGGGYAHVYCTDVTDPAGQPDLEPLTGLDEDVISRLEHEQATPLVYAEAFRTLRASGDKKLAFVSDAGTRRAVYFAEGVAAILRAQGKTVRVEHAALERAERRRRYPARGVAAWLRDLLARPEPGRPPDPAGDFGIPTKVRQTHHALRTCVHSRQRCA